MKPEQIGAELNAFTAIPRIDRLGDNAKESIFSAKNELGARLESLFTRMEALTESMERLTFSEDYNGPRFVVPAPEVTAFRDSELKGLRDGQLVTVETEEKVRCAIFDLPLKPEELSQMGFDANVRLRRRVHIGYLKTRTFEKVGDEEAFGFDDYEIESLTTLLIDDKNPQDTSLVRLIDDFLVVEATSFAGLFDEAGAHQPEDYDSEWYEEAKLLSDRRLATSDGVTILANLDIESFEQAIDEIEARVAA